MPEYVDRGIIKWQPFDALEGQHSLLQSLRHERGRLLKPELSEDHYDIMNQTLQDAIQTHALLHVSFYQDGYIRTTFGHIINVDNVKRILILTTKERIALDAVTDVNII